MFYANSKSGIILNDLKILERRKGDYTKGDFIKKKSKKSYRENLEEFKMKTIENKDPEKICIKDLTIT